MRGDCQRGRADERYPYGYAHAEDLAGIGIVIWARAVLAGEQSIHKLAGHGAIRKVG